MKKPLIPSLSLLLYFAIFGCSVQFESDLLLSAGGCDEPGIEFQKTIVPLLERNCFGCHSNSTYALNGNSIDLDGYDDLLEYVESGIFLGAIKHEADFEPMPQQGNKLSLCSITKIETWISEGYPQN